MKKMNAFERALGLVSPRWALNRFYNRVKLESSARAYEAVETSRLRKKREDARSPDQLGTLSVDKLRMQGRYFDENYDVAKSVLNTLVSHVVGKGILTFPMVKTTTGELAVDVNDQLTNLWAMWSKFPEVTREYSWAKCQRLAARSWFRDGEMFSQLVEGIVPGLQHGSDIFLSLELMEADFCPVGLFDAKKNVVQGVEKDEWGKPSAYWLWKSYPTETLTPFGTITFSPISTMFTTNNSNFNRIDAMSMLHLKFIERIRQTRGISIFASVYKRLDDLKDYEESERIAARIGAAFALAITKSMDAPPGTTSEAKWREMDLAPGIIADGLAPGEEIKSIANDRPSNLITDFRTSQIRSIAGGTNAGFSSVSKQYEGSYSSQRQELMEQNNIYHAIREEFTSVFVDRAYRSFVRMVVAQGLLQGGAGIDLATILDAEHVGRGIPYIEPKRETEADEKKVLSGFASRSQIILERGGNPQIVRKQIAEERKQDEEMDLNFSSTNSGVAAAGSAPGAAPGDEDDVKPADDEPGDEEEADRMEDGNLYEVDGRVYLCEDGELKLYEKQNSA